MNSNVFPEDMNPISADNIKEAIRTMDEYMRYMTERMNFFCSNIERRLIELEKKVAEGE